MWELICHHTYRFNGLPVDLSPYDCHGETFGNPQFLEDGASTGSGALRFSASAGVHIPPGRAWNPLGGIIIEVTARIDGPRGLPRILIRGDESFLFLVWARELVGSYYTNNPTYPGSDHERVGSGWNPARNPPYAVPFNQWVRFTFFHNGIDTFQLYADGDLVAELSVHSWVPPVGPGGVLIGAGVPMHVLDGAIDEVKVWRVNPHAMTNQFIARPVDPNVAECWERFIRAVEDALAKHPDCARLFQASRNLLQEALLKILTKGPETRERMLAVWREYDRLWRAGQICGPDMERLVRDWMTWLRLVGIRPEDNAELMALAHSSCLKTLLRELPTIECDPEYAALLRMIADALGHAGHSTAS
jgi:concanavalin A-like lectin/glucanase superfamily protein